MADPLVHFVAEDIARQREALAGTEVFRVHWLGGGIRGRDWVAYESVATWRDRNGVKRELRTTMPKPPSWCRRDVIRVPDIYAEEVFSRAAIMGTQIPEHLNFHQVSCVVEILWLYHLNWVRHERGKSTSSEDDDGTGESV